MRYDIILSQARSFAVCFQVINYLKRLRNIHAVLSQTQIQAVNLEHIAWVSFYFPTEKKGEFFDSYGHPPEFYRDSFGDFLEKYSYEYNTARKLQSAWSDVCGQYCMFYLSQRARGHCMNKIVHLFDNNTMSNDNKVFTFVNKHFNILPNVLDKIYNQSSKKLVED